MQCIEKRNTVEHGRIMFLDFVHLIIYLRNTTFRKLNVFLPSGKMFRASIVLGPLERDNFSHRTPVSKAGEQVPQHLTG
jgi:hypothetical protein